MTENQLPLEEQAPKTKTLDDFFFHAADYVYRKRKLFTLIAIAFVAIVVGVYGILEYQASQKQKRQEALFHLEKKIAQNALNPSALEGQLVPELTAFIEANQGSQEELLARFHRSGLNLKLKKIAEAEQDLRVLEQNLEPKSQLYILSVVSLANVLRDRGQDGDALSTLLAAKEKAPSDMILVELADYYYSTQNREEGQKVLNDLVNQYPESLFRDYAEEMLKNL